MERFKALDFKAHPTAPNDGVRATMTFPNGYKASVIRTRWSYGGDDGLYELAVMDAEGDIVYDTPVTSDVEGYCSEARIDELLGQILDLPTRGVLKA